MTTKILIGALIWFCLSCGENANDDANLNSESPGALDSTTKHPNGVTSGSVISTDTGAMRVVDSTDDK
jgi:hypothetical protein